MFLSSKFPRPLDPHSKDMYCELTVGFPLYVVPAIFKNPMEYEEMLVLARSMSEEIRTKPCFFSAKNKDGQEGVFVLRIGEKEPVEGSLIVVGKQGGLLFFKRPEVQIPTNLSRLA